MFEKLIEEFSALAEVEAVALGGSRSGTRFDAKSDYDVYLYCTGPVAESCRREILEKYCCHIELGNCFWELEDNCTMKNGVDIDILYRNLEDFAADVASVAERFQARNGYTTCMWHNLQTCRILYDRNNGLQALKDRFQIPYPEPLRENIISRNRALLHGFLPSYDGQIWKAASRMDLVSINHRVSAFLESYFDILFALNRQTHPGEKRLMALCRESCPVLPENFEENISALFADMFRNPEALAGALTKIIIELEKIL